MRLGWCRSFHSATNCSSLNASFGCRIKARSETAGSWLLRVDLCADSGERVAVRPGGSYGDWVTNLVVDPYKESRGRWLSRTGPNTQGDARLSSVAHIHPITQTTPVVPDDTGDYCALRMTKASVFSS